MKRSLALLVAVLATFAPAFAGAADEQPPVEAGKDVPSPQRVKFVLPKYPAGALSRGERALVILDVVVGEDGKVEDVKVLHGAPIFGAAAVEAVKQWRYEVSRIAGRPVRVKLTVPVSFAMKLPDMLRENGIPELRLGNGPGTPSGAGSTGGSAVAQVTIDAEGRVTHASVVRGESPWTDALLEAIKTWRFAEPESGKPLQVDVHADFKGGATRKVELALTDPKPVGGETRTADAGGGIAAAEAPAAPPAPAAPAAPSAPPAPAAPAAPVAPPAAGVPTEVPAPGVPTSDPGLTPATTPPPPVVPPTAPLPTVAVRPTLPSATAQATGTAAVRPTVAPPRATRAPVEVVGGFASGPGPATPPPPPENGASTVRDVRFVGEGIPDLVRGRRPVPPPSVRLSGHYGDVTVRFSIDSGGVTTVTGAEGTEGLTEAAESVVRSWSFRRTNPQRVYAVAQIHYAPEGALATVTANSGQ